MGVVHHGWGLHLHAFTLGGGQASHCNAGVVGVMPAVWSGRCVFEARLGHAVSVGWIIVVAVLLGCFR